jgi:amidase
LALIESSQFQVFFDRGVPAVARVRPGDLITFETLDAGYNRIRTLEDLRQHIAERDVVRPRGNPITGPVYVEGVRPGQTLVVDIVSIELAEWGFQVIGPKRGVVRDEIADWDVYALRAVDGQIVFPNGMTLPAKPVVGTLGNAPSAGKYNHATPLGGNLDVPEIGEGSRVYLPIEVDGALFSLGDVHARQGDGELVGAPEFAARVTVRLSVTDDVSPRWPIVEAGGCWQVITSAPTEAECLRLGAHEAARLITEKHGLPLTDALFLLTMTARLTCSRTGDFGGLWPVTSTAFPLDLIARAAATFRHADEAASLK